MNEPARLEAVRRFDKYDFDLNKNLDGILKLAADIYESPAAFITLIDEDSQWFKVRHGFEVLQMPRATSFCTHTIMQGDTFVVNDAFADDRFANNPFVQNVPNVRFYAGATLASNEGQHIGSLCVMDAVPKEVTENKKALLKILARQCIHLMELDLTYKLLDEKMQQVEKQNKTLLSIAHIQSHEFRGPLATVMGLMNVIRDSDIETSREYLPLLEQAVNKLDEQIHVVVRSAESANEAYVHSTIF